MERDHLLASLFDFVPSLLVFVDGEGRIVHVNPAVAERLGRPLIEIVGAAWSDFVPENDRAASQALLSAALSGGVVRGHQHPLRTPDGESRSIEWSARPVRIDGPIIGVLYAGCEAPEVRGLYETVFVSALDQQVLLLVEGDGALRILAANAAAQSKFRRLRFSDWPLEGKTVEQVFAAIRSEPRISFPHAHVARIERRRVEFQRTYRIGSEAFHFEGAVAPIFDARGECSHLLWCARDVTARVAAEEGLRARQERLLAAQEVAGLGSWELDLGKDRAVWWSPEVYRLLEVDPTTPGTFERFLDALEPKDRERIAETFESILRGVAVQEVYAHTVQLRLPEGRRRYIHSRAQPRYDEDGRLVRLLGTLQDVTSSVEADGRLRRALAELWRAQNTLLLAERAARLGSMLYALEGHELFASPGMQHLFGLDPNEPVTGLSLLARIHPDDRAKARAVSRIASGDVPEPIEYRVTLADGEERVYQSTAQITLVDDEPVLLAVTQDITDQRRSADALARSLAEKDALLREIHHRVKNNLQLVSSLLHFHARRVSDPTARGALEETSRRLLSMILVHDKLHPSARSPTVPMDGYLRDLVAAAVGPAAATYKVDLALAAFVLPIDVALAIGMITVELVTNVLKHAYPGAPLGEVAVTLAGVESRWTLEVADRGRGLPDGLDVQSGGSLGWDLIHLWVTQLGADVDVHSTPSGATVRVSCPAR